MKTLRVLVCGGDGEALREVAQELVDEGVKVETSTRVIDHLCRPNQEWDLLLVDLDGLTTFLRGLLPAVRLQFPHLNILGVTRGSVTDVGYLAHDVQLDGYLFRPPRPEDLIIRIPRLAAGYLCDINARAAVESEPLLA